MPQGIPKQAIPLNFSQGLDTKSDRKQVQLGKFLKLQNSIFTKAGLLQKRNGYGYLPALPDASSSFLTTFNGNLTAIGTSLNALVTGIDTWINKGFLQPVQLSTMPLIRSNTNQIYADSAIAPNGLICTVFTDNVPVSGSIVVYQKYVIADSVTGQNLTAPTTIVGSPTGVIGTPRVFVVGNYFIVVFDNNVSGSHSLGYMAINYNNPRPYSTPVAGTISTSFNPTTPVNFDGVVVNNNLYLAWRGADAGNALRMAYISSTLVVSSPVIFSGYNPINMSVTSANYGANFGTTAIIATFYDGTTIYSVAVTPLLATLAGYPLTVTTASNVVNLNSVGINNPSVPTQTIGYVTITYEVANNYGYDSALPSNYTVTGQIEIFPALSLFGSQTYTQRSVGLASKAFLIDGYAYYLATYYSVFQPTYFLMRAGCQANGLNVGGPVVVAKLAYENGGGYLTKALPSVSVNGTTASIPYLYKDLIQAVNKTQGVSNAAGVYSQTGINIANFNLATAAIDSSEIGQNLNITGGFLWGYDGYDAVENGFFVWPDNVEAAWSASGGSMAAKPDSSTNTNAYYYQVTYEWSDNQGNLYRSAPSIPVGVTTSGSGTSGSVTLNIPTLRLTYKINNPVKIVIYRWSVGQETYYQTTSIQNPILNNTAVDYVTYVDTLADSSIIGNNIIYTNGGVLENISPPATNIITLFNNRIWLVDAEDPNLLWYSKQVIEATPVEMSDLLTLYVAPTTGAQGSTGNITALAPMDDKLCIFKKDAIFYLNGVGPDNTGSNSQYSDAQFITSTVGCIVPQSIVFMPQGLMFQSDKGIWLLGRDMNTSYIGAPVEDFTQGALVQSAVNVPGTNQVRFTLSSGITLMYDYFYGQWGTFVNVPAISSTLYQGLHTYINSYGQVFQETPGLYLDGSSPVLMAFSTSWINMAGLQGYERAYRFDLIGDYLSPHDLYVTLGYDYNDSPTQAILISPTNYSPAYGGDPLYGDGSPYGGPGSLEQWTVWPQRQRCQAYQISVQEVYNPAYGVPAGAGFTMSGLNLIIGAKKGYRPARASTQAG